MIFLFAIKQNRNIIKIRWHALQSPTEHVFNGLKVDLGDCCSVSQQDSIIQDSGTLRLWNCTYLEGFLQFLIVVALLHVLGHHGQELGEIDGAVTVSINLEN